LGSVPVVDLGENSWGTLTLDLGENSWGIPTLDLGENSWGTLTLDLGENSWGMLTLQTGAWLSSSRSEQRAGTRQRGSVSTALPWPQLSPVSPEQVPHRSPSRGRASPGSLHVLRHGRTAGIPQHGATFPFVETGHLKSTSDHHRRRPEAGLEQKRGIKRHLTVPSWGSAYL